MGRGYVALMSKAPKSRNSGRSHVPLWDLLRLPPPILTIGAIQVNGGEYKKISKNQVSGQADEKHDPGHGMISRPALTLTWVQDSDPDSDSETIL